jgi:hypothetical protein
MKDLFGNEIPEDTPIPKKKDNQGAINAHRELLRLYNERVGETCKNCALLTANHFSKTYYKCSKFSTSGSQSSDWRVSWQACGLFELYKKQGK